MLEFTRYEILTFDCYGTLINWEAGILSALHRILSAHAKTLDDATLLKFYGDFELRSEEGIFRPYKEVLASVVRQFGTQLGFTPTAEEIRSLPDSLPTWKPWPDTVAALKLLKNRFRLAILSNVDDDLFAATQLQLGVDFDEVIHRAASSGIQAVPQAFRASPEPHQRSRPPCASCRPEHLSRCHSRPSSRPGHRVGKPSLSKARRRSGQSRGG